MRSKCLVPNHKDSSIAFLIYLSDILSIQTVFEMIQSIYMVYLFKNYCNIWLYDFWVTEKLINHLSSHAGELLACSSRSIYKFVTSEWNLWCRSAGWFSDQPAGFSSQRHYSSTSRYSISLSHNQPLQCFGFFFSDKRTGPMYQIADQSSFLMVGEPKLYHWIF